MFVAGPRANRRQRAPTKGADHPLAHQVHRPDHQPFRQARGKPVAERRRVGDHRGDLTPAGQERNVVRNCREWPRLTWFVALACWGCLAIGARLAVADDATRKSAAEKPEASDAAAAGRLLDIFRSAN